MPIQFYDSRRIYKSQKSVQSNKNINDATQIHSHRPARHGRLPPKLISSQMEPQTQSMGHRPRVQRTNFPGLAKEVVGKCGGIPEGGYVCGSFGPGKIVAMRAIYKCVDGNLARNEVCSEKASNNRCEEFEEEGEEVLSVGEWGQDCLSEEEGCREALRGR